MAYVMTREHVGRNAGNFGRIGASGSDLDRLGYGIADAVDVGGATPVARLHTDGRHADESLVARSA